MSLEKARDAQSESEIQVKRINAISDLQDIIDNPREILIINEESIADVPPATLVEHLRARNCSQYVLFVEKPSTYSEDASERIQRRIDFINAGGDMVVEDAHTPVLDSCIRALRKRIEMVLRAREMQAVNFSNGLQINYANLKVSVNNRPVDLTSGEFSVLAVLSRHPKRFVGFASIRDEIFLSSSNSNLDLRENADANNFSVLIYRLRKKLGPDVQITTAPRGLMKAGYALDADIV